MVDQVGEVDGSTQPEEPLKGGPKARVVEEWSDVSINSPIASRRPSLPEPGVQQQEPEDDGTADDNSHGKVTKEGEMIEHGEHSGSEEENDKEPEVKEEDGKNADEQPVVSPDTENTAQEPEGAVVEQSQETQERDLPPLPAPSPTA